MNIQIDTLNKVIKLPEAVNLGELGDVLNKLFPNNTWREYKLEVNTIVNWSNPIIIDRWPTITYTWPWWSYGSTYVGTGTPNDFVVTANTGDGNFNVNTITTSSGGTYNVCINAKAES